MNKTIVSAIKDLVFMLIFFLIGLQISRHFLGGNIIFAILIMMVLNFLFTFFITFVEEYIRPGTLDEKEVDLQKRKDTVKIAQKKLENKVKNKFQK